MSLFSSLAARSALKSLAAMSDHQLSDIGLCRHDIVEARSASNAVDFLAARRNERATFWLS